MTAIESCLTRAENFRNRRNAIVHALYTPAESGSGLEAMNPLRKSLGYRASSVSVEEMEALADEVTLLKSDMFRAGWNARAARMPGMQKSPQPAPGQTVNEVIVPE